MASDDHRAPGFRPPADDGDSREVHRRVVLEAPPDEVWGALTDPAELASWWGEGTELDVRPGGEGRMVEDGEPVRRARVVEVRPGRSLMLDWWPEDAEVDEPAARVTFELLPCPFGTILHVRECPLLDLSGLASLSVASPAVGGRPWSLRGRGPRALARV
jgi:uncharacterized protein YndB with AHSA1/START domain